MVENYWYISRPKVELLKGKASRWHLEEVSLGLKAHWFEAGAKLRPDAALVEDLKRVTREIESEPRVPEFQLITPEEAPGIFSWNGEAGRMISGGCYWVAMAKGDCALLLAGSAANAIAGGTAEGSFPFSADPVGAVGSFFNGSPQDEAMLSIVWRRVMEGAFGARSLARPKVEGLGLFAGMFGVKSTEMAATPWPDVERVVVGSPIYIKQL